MSWDVSLEVRTPHRSYDVHWCGDYTSNVSPMYHLVFPDIDEDTWGIRGLSGKTAEEAAPLLRSAVLQMTADPERFRALNPENGWGDYEGALDFLNRILRDCEQHPGTHVRVT